MPRRTKQESLLTRERILDAALAVFHERGVARPSLSDVAARIGMTRGAVYGHFRNKGEVLVALFERERLPWETLDPGAAWPTGPGCARSARGVAPDAPDAPDALETLRRTVAGMLRHSAGGGERRARVLGVLFYRVELAVENEALRARVQVARDEAFARLLALACAAAAAGALPGRRDPHRDARLLLQGVHGAILDWLWEPTAFDLAAEADRIADGLLAALGAEATLAAAGPPASAEPTAPARPPAAQIG